MTRHYKTRVYTAKGAMTSRIITPETKATILRLLQEGVMHQEAIARQCKCCSSSVKIIAERNGIVPPKAPKSVYNSATAAAAARKASIPQHREMTLRDYYTGHAHSLRWGSGHGV